VLTYSFASGETTTFTWPFYGLVPGGAGRRVGPLWQQPQGSETLGGVFERFTDRARRVLVLAQEEARLLNHGFIGTEHILLGLIHEGEGVAAQALAQMEISLDAVREIVEEAIGLSTTVPMGSPPFTPRAKKVLELSLREALQLGHNYIGTEHMLLGLLREGEGVGAQALVSLGADLDGVRQTVIRLLAGAAGPEASFSGPRADQPARGWRSRSGARSRGRLAACSFCGRRPPETGQLIAGGDAFICEHCVRHWSGSLSMSPGRQPLSGLHRTEGLLVETAGPPPEDEDAARAEIAAAFASSATPSEDGASVPSVEGGANLGPTLLAAQGRSPFPPSAEVSIDVDYIAFLDPEHAAVSFTITIGGVPRLPDRRGDAVVVDGAWKMARSTFCELMRVAGVDCPPRP
jgi:hypothetical protein